MLTKKSYCPTILQREFAKNSSGCGSTVRQAQDGEPLEPQSEGCTLEGDDFLSAEADMTMAENPPKSPFLKGGQRGIITRMSASASRIHNQT